MHGHQQIVRLDTYVITFEVTDGYLSDSEAVTITVNDVNHAPVITGFVPADGSVFNEVDIITIDVTASDADGQALSYIIKINGVTQSSGPASHDNKPRTKN
ncbi:MAG: hypothetical protein C5S43_04005 [Candidatus Methanocomedens sp.]|nr:MAG: hypothetical protein C5S43_04005 [ANME-2 cluster archaeon]